MNGDKPMGFWRIEDIQNQLGRGLHGALAYTGATHLVYKCRNDDSPSVDSKVLESGLVDYEIGLLFNVNGKLGWKMLITLEGNDTYTVRLMHIYGTTVKHLDEATDVYCDSLQDIVQGMYDDAINKYLGGWIPI